MLLLCGKNISAHTQSVVVIDVESIILAQAMFTARDDILRMTICPAYRSSVWVTNRLSTMPEIVSSHARGKSRKAYFEIKDHSQTCGYCVFIYETPYIIAAKKDMKNI